MSSGRIMTVTVGNQWNTLTYKAGERVIEAGQTWLVRWIDGNLSQETITSTTEFVDTYDHGHTYKTKQVRLFVCGYWHGHIVHVPLEDVSIVLEAGDEE